MALLLASLLPLFLGPIVVVKARGLRSAAVAMDAFVVVAIGGLVLVHLLPQSLTDGGAWAFLAMVLGLVAPWLAERRLFRGDHAQGGRLLLVLALFGLAAHALVDGLALGHEHAHHHPNETPGAHDHEGQLAAWAVLIHRLPVAVGIWWLIPQALGRRVAIGTLGLIGTATVAGYFLRGQLHLPHDSEPLAVFQALLAGSLLHVVLHSHLPRAERTGTWDLASAVGTALAVGVLFAVNTTHPSPAVTAAGGAFLSFAADAAPALLLAYLCVGFLHELVPTRVLAGLSRGKPLLNAARGVAAGLPIPVCSCGIVPLYRELVTRGAPVSAGLAFLVATPELDLAAFLLSWQLLGPELSVARLIGAAVLALAVGWWVGSRAPDITPDPADPGPEVAPTGPRRSWSTVIPRALRFGFTDGVDSTAPWLLFGLGIAALASPHIHPGWLAGAPTTLQVVGAAVLGLPLYVCATGSTPFAALLIASGLSPGAGVAFLLTGPATNITTFGMLRQLHGSPVAAWFGVAMVLGAVVVGVSVDMAVSGQTLPHMGDMHLHDPHLGPVQWVLLAALGALFLASLLRQGTRRFLERITVSAPVPHSHPHAGPAVSPTVHPPMPGHGSCCH